MVVLAALRARIKGWVPAGKYRLGRWAMPVNVGALVYGVAAIINICWPRTPDAPWYDNYIVLLMSAHGHRPGPAVHGDEPSLCAQHRPLRRRHSCALNVIRRAPRSPQVRHPLVPG